jgi:hypothetical protein
MRRGPIKVGAPEPAGFWSRNNIARRVFRAERHLDGTPRLPEPQVLLGVGFGSGAAPTPGTIKAEGIDRDADPQWGGGTI